ACRVAGIENDMAMIHHDLGNLLYRSKQFDEAEKEYREAISYRPDFARAHANLGFLCKRSGRQGEAIREFKAALNSKEHLPDRGERITQILKEIDI
ncbi:MAG: tetratricopeptide repeat protein, partial [Candidatus Syntropharchaeales archaeon]